jgi:branched-chain amino acid transport system permease protein
LIGQILLDGVLTGAMIALGAIGLTLTYAVLRFANFVHGEWLTMGAYLTLVAAGGVGPLLGAAGDTIGPLTFGWTLIVSAAIAALATGLLAAACDWALFRPLRRRSNEIGLVIASFGASLALRSCVEFLFTGRPALYSTDIPMALRLGFGMRATPDLLALLALLLLLMLCTHLLMERAPLGRSMRAVSENPDLARLCGVDVAATIRATWMLGGALAALAGVAVGVVVQIRPYMGFDLLLPMFSAAILGGIGSVPGAMLGGLIVGLGESVAVPLIGAQYRAAVAFLLLIAMLAARPHGLLGRARA